MKALAIIPFLIASTLAFAETPLDRKNKRELITLDFLMESCAVIGETTNGMVPDFDCESYLYGIIDTTLARHKGENSCPLKSLAPWQLYKDIEPLVPRSEWQKPAAPLVISVLQKRYPCK